MIKVRSFFGRLIFASRWLQAPLYLGLIITLALYLYEFCRNLWLLVRFLNNMPDTAIMLEVLDLIDVVLIANLLIMIIMSGYQNFVSRLSIEDHPDKPDWFDSLDAGTMKIKVAVALIAISSIHLLRTFIAPAGISDMTIMWQVVIHLTLLVSALTLAVINKLMDHPPKD